MKKLFVFLLLIITLHSVQTKNCLQVGLIPSEEIYSMLKEYEPWKKWMVGQLGKCIDLVPTKSYSNLIKLVEEDKIDIARFGPFSYVVAASRAYIEPIVVEVREKTGQGFYYSYLETSPEIAKELGINEPLIGEEGMKALKNILKNYKYKWSIGFTDISSTSGYAVPNYYMSIADLNPKEFFKEIKFLGTHDSAQLAVYTGIVPIVASNDLSLKRGVHRGKIDKKKIKIIWRSDKIPGSPIIVNSRLSEDLKRKIKNALLTMPTSVVPKYEKNTKYIETSKKEYIVIEKIRKFLEKN